MPERLPMVRREAVTVVNALVNHFVDGNTARAKIDALSKLDHANILECLTGETHDRRAHGFDTGQLLRSVTSKAAVLFIGHSIRIHGCVAVKFLLPLVRFYVGIEIFIEQNDLHS